MAIGKTIELGGKIASFGVNTRDGFIEFEDIEMRIREMYRWILKELIFRVETFIKTKIPKRTGQLRADVLLSLYASKITQEGAMDVNIGSSLHYAEFVNEMSTMQVRHVGEESTAYYGGHKGKIRLIDPLAIGHFLDILYELIDDTLTNLWQLAVDMFFGGTGMVGRKLREMDIYG